MSLGALKKPLTGLFISAAGVGATSLTMFLTNAMKNIGVLDKLDLQERPEVQEDEMEPAAKPVAAPESENSPSSPQAGGKQNQEQGEDQASASDQGTEQKEDSQDSQSLPESSGGQQASSPEQQLQQTDDSQNGANASSGGDTQQTQNASTPADAGQENIIEVIKRTIIEINGNNWTERGNEIMGAYSAITRVSILAEALDT